ncbi:MAG: hypothetical protein LBH20_06025 [Treponema sp.]|jgi:hypothetical protein|nr:hypothetical protein [Treponema sp.]
MKNFSKKIWIIAVVGFLMVGINSCEKEGGGGGTIVVTNNHSWIIYDVKIVDVSYIAVTGEVPIYPNNSQEFVVNKDGSYWVGYNIMKVPVWHYDIKVSVNGGKTVNVTVSDY